MSESIDARLAQLERMVTSLQQRISMMVAFSRSTMDPREGGAVQLVQARHSALELHSDVVRLQDFGFASVPPAGTDMVTIFMGGDRGAAVVIAAGNQATRPRDLAPGDVAVYDGRGHRIRLEAGKITVEAGGDDIEVTNAGTLSVTAADKVRLVTPLLEVTGDIVDRCDTDGESMATARSVYNTHHHDVVGVQGGGSTIQSEVPTEQI